MKKKQKIAKKDFNVEENLCAKISVCIAKKNFKNS
jgi:hypothetical protein